ncbi:MAG: peptidylprolyl isomerase [Pseudomonadota bacterium]
MKSTDPDTPDHDHINVKEPLYHFLLAGFMVFLLFWFTSDQQNDIVISQSEIQRMSMLWEAQWRRPPTKDELQRIIDLRVREEVLAREAMSRGFMNNDSVVRRRLAQKIENYESDVASLSDPPDDIITPYFEANSDRYRVPAVLSFRHHYFSTDRRDAAAMTDAKQTLKALRGNPDGSQALYGDTFHEGHRFDASLPRITRVFGDQFGLKLRVALETAGDHDGLNIIGPLRSAYGVHIVEIEDYIPAHIPPMADVRDRVLTDWRQSQLEKTKDDYYASIRGKYIVTIAGKPAATGE